MKLAIVSDAWRPQINGVVRTLERIAAELTARGDRVDVIGPERFRNFAMPGYAEIRLALLPRAQLARMLEEMRPDALHVATEGPLGLAARAIAIQRGWRFTTSFHTRFAEYVSARTGIPPRVTWALLRRFHNAGAGTLAATPSLREELAQRGFRRILPWTRGVDLDQFRPGLPAPCAQAWAGLPRPIFLYAGRVAIEKNISAFLDLDLPGSKVVVGDGPQRAALQARHPSVHFAGWREGEGLAQAYRGADVMVFPSRTDTFGLVLLEAMASGTPVAAFPVMGPRDVVGAGGVLDEDLRRACLAALEVPRTQARAQAEQFSWPASAQAFRDNLTLV
ncbi:glycosyltransferase family 1 protein [Roseococcus sp. SDR]|uniref:glycosyltransferase family 4 protein n=1 Tax=Roseococcus sp. SDR TaxID=2835532 RepID=UPI001BCF947E|nr:glycosyltransferase family 1 protein [Roseococcus sp. SDR]MBS7793133.1 glycosyltransferase family 1 protein [Roseococcus sp. SDR]MBV1848447.1 glycosyltransferase family 1 protein [Roseococcus sp. SDR]